MNTFKIQSSTQTNLEAAFGGESMASRKYLFFAEVAKKLGNQELARLFRETAAQETEHAFAHFRLLHPELVFENPESRCKIMFRMIRTIQNRNNYKIMFNVQRFRSNKKCRCYSLLRI